MRTRQCTLALVSGATLGLAAAMIGCRPVVDELSPLGAVAIVGPEYSASKGLFVPEETRRSIGLRITDVAEENLARRIELSLRVYEVSRERVRASGLVSREQAQSLRAAQRLEVRLPSGARETVAVAGFSERGQAFAGGGEVLVEFPRTSGVGLGTFVTAIARLEATEPRATVPRSAVVHGTNGDFVYTVSGEHFVRTPVKIGAIAGERVEIADGLYSGDQVVSEAAMSLWLTELAAVKGGHACCVVPAKGK